MSEETMDRKHYNRKAPNRPVTPLSFLWTKKRKFRYLIWFRYVIYLYLGYKGTFNIGVQLRSL